jgi:hypothetical protein
MVEKWNRKRHITLKLMGTAEARNEKAQICVIAVLTIGYTFVYLLLEEGEKNLGLRCSPR